MNIRIITILIAGAVFTAGLIMGFGGYVFAGDPVPGLEINIEQIPGGSISAKSYDSLLSNKTVGQVRMEVGNILLGYGFGGKYINQVTEALEGGGVYEAELKSFLLAIGMNEQDTQNILLEFDKIGISEGGAVPVNVATPPISTTVIKKCGVNTYRVSNECGVGAFKNAYVQCYDGYEENLGGESSCKSSEVWQKYAQEVCANRCSVIGAPQQPAPKPKPLPTPAPIPVPIEIGKPIAVCYIPDKLTKDYNQLILDLKKAEEAGNKETAELIIKKITALKLEIERARKECLTNTAQPQKALVRPELHRPPAAIAIDRCQDVIQWENKISYYQKLAALSDSELKEQTGFSRAEIERVLADLPQGLVKVKAQCDEQKNTGVKSATAIAQIIAEPVKPVAVESGQEIDKYYKAKIEAVTAEENTDVQIKKLKSLKGEIDELIAKLIKGRKEIEASELGNAVAEIKVSRGEIKADDVAIKTTDKRILIEVGGKPTRIMPTARQVEIVEIKDGDDMTIKATEVSIKDNKLRVGNSEVKLAASEVAEKLNVRPQAAELKEENSRAVYKFKVAEPRKLFGFIPMQITKTMTADAESSDLLGEKLPWFSFLTTR